MKSDICYPKKLSERIAESSSSGLLLLAQARITYFLRYQYVFFLFSQPAEWKKLSWFPHQCFDCSKIISPTELSFCTAPDSLPAAPSGAVTVPPISNVILLDASADPKDNDSTAGGHGHWHSNCLWQAFL